MSALDAQLRLRLGASGPASPRLRVVWAALLTMVTVASFAVLLTTPFSAEEGEFIHALRSGEITTLAVGHSADFYSASGFNTPGFNTSGVNTVGFNDPHDIAVSWANRFGFRREAVLQQLGGLAQDAETTAQTTRLDPAGSIVRTARSLGAVAPAVVQPGELRFDRLKWLSVLVLVLMVGILLYGPRPRRMTKWGAFWAYLIPFNVGIFYALLRDSPWNRKMAMLPEPEVRERVVVDPITNEAFPRYGGWAMFFWSAIIASLAITLVLLFVAWTFPTYLDPVGWSAVDVAGNPVTLFGVPPRN